MIGILAYGSLIDNPGSDLDRLIIEKRPCETPFSVEYARRSKSRENAPTLVPVPDGCGEPVKGVILVLRAETIPQVAKKALFRRELHKENDETAVYDDAVQRAKKDAIVIETILHFHGFGEVYYTVPKVNFHEILDASRPQEEKARLLAQAAIDSLTQDTFTKGLDGIQYLHDNIQAGILTPLTEPYRQAILTLAGNAPDLLTAREILARQKGIIP